MLRVMSPGKEMEVDKDTTDIYQRKKPVENYNAETAKVLEEASSLASKSKVEEALGKLMYMEKKARLGNDHKNVEKCCIAILKTLEREKDYENLNKYIMILCKRRGQTDAVQTAIISFAANNLVPGIKIKQNDAKMTKVKEELISTLRSISEGKMMVEVVRARLTKMLAQMKEAQGKDLEAAKIIQEETPETYTTMENREKSEFLMEQIRLCLKTKDFVRGNIIAKKVDRTKLEQHEDIKVQFYELLVQYFLHEKDCLELAKSFLQIYKTNGDKSSLKMTIVFLAAAPYDNHQVDLIHNVLADKELKNFPEFDLFLRRFVTPEISQWPLKESANVLPEAKTLIPDQTASTFDWLQSTLKDRVVQHDIRVVAGYYKRIPLPRLAQMLEMSEDSVEKYISDMVSGSETEEVRLVAKIDRCDGIVDFQKQKSSEEIVSDWQGGISELLKLVEKTCHLIHKETMIHNANSANKQA